MNNKHRKTLSAIFDTPVRSDVNWMEIEKLVVSLGGRVVERAGSRVGLDLNGVWGLFHRPHPEKVTDKGALKSVREFLLNAGVTPDEL